MKKRSKVIAGSVLTMAMCASLATGATFALFTSESSVNVAVTSAKVNVSAKVDDTTIVTATDSSMAPNQAFKAEYKNGTLQVVNMAAGDSVKFDIVVTNESSIAVKYRTTLSVRDSVANGETYNSLFGDLDVTFGGADTHYNGDLLVSNWAEFAGDTDAAGKLTNTKTIPVTVSLPVESKASGAACTFTFGVEAVQGNATTSDDTILSVEAFNEFNKVKLNAFCEAQGTRDITVTLGNRNLNGEDLEFGRKFRKCPDQSTPVDIEDIEAINLTLVGGVINTGCTGYKDIDSPANGVYFNLPAKSSVTVKGVTVNGNYKFGINVYTQVKWAGMTKFTFEDCTFNGGWAGHIAAEEFSFVNCTFRNSENTVSPSNCMPFWLRPGVASSSARFDPETVTMKDCKVFASSPVKFENFQGTDFVFENNEFTTDKNCPGKTDTRDFGIEFVKCTGGSLTLTNNKLVKGTALVTLYSANSTANNFTAVTDQGNVYEQLCGLWKTGEELDLNWYVVTDADKEIATATTLRTFAADVNAGNTYKDKTVKLTADIDLENKDWTPIGSAEYDNVPTKQNATMLAVFSGTFDGNGKKISNLNFKGDKKHSAGLFGYAKYATIKNFTLEGATFDSAPYVGGVAGVAIGDVTIEDVTVDRLTLTNGIRQSGGIVGYANRDGGSATVLKITRCTVKNSNLQIAPEWIQERQNGQGEFDNGDKVGGILGYQQNKIEITNCTVDTVTLTAYRDIGGIAGMLSNTNSGEVYAQSSVITGNTVKNVTKVLGDENDYGKTNRDQTVGNYYGRKEGAEGNYVIADNTVDGVEADN